MVFAGPTDVETAYEGSLPAGSEARVQYLLDTVSARLRRLLPTLEERIAAEDAEAFGESDLSLLTKDTVVQAVLRRLPGTVQQVESQTQSAGPWSVTNRYTVDSTQTFSDDDLDLLRGSPAASHTGIGTISLGLVYGREP